MKDFCSDKDQTVCVPCEEGHYASKFNMFDRCEECQSCQQEYAEKCTPTTDAKCLCRSGFLCSNNVCSSCEENKCVTGEKLNRTGSIKYTYHCEPLCPDNAYFDVEKEVCTARTQCSLIGLAERFPGNKTYNSICDRGENHGNNRNMYMFLGVGFVFLSFTILVISSHVCIKNLRKHKAYARPVDIVLPTKPNDFHLSKEESGFSFQGIIFQDESKNTESLECI
ncbi:Tumor necrosis factor receptor superfamily member 5 [Larimichthys crocea]|uniref:Uncharacterized protein n=1 Tax=Larimichthys crocea TaxID=215358 RepID=A0ACD3RI98_LARCR|nr:Tumor necrosis factor receptor superfamily member 5 [Larimichthys crocea]